MNIYQKAIEVKNECKSRKKCDECKYTNYCSKTAVKRLQNNDELL